MLNKVVTLRLTSVRVITITEPDKSSECFIICTVSEKLQVQLSLKQVFETGV